MDTCKKNFLVHDELPDGMGENNIRVYLEILRDAGSGWQPGEAHEFIVVFPLSCREMLRGILQK